MEVILSGYIFSHDQYNDIKSTKVIYFALDNVDKILNMGGFSPICRKNVLKIHINRKGGTSDISDLVDKHLSIRVFRKKYKHPKFGVGFKYILICIN